MKDTVKNLLENASVYDASDLSIDLDRDSIELDYFNWDGSGSPDYSLECDYARLESVSINGRDLDEYHVIRSDYVDALAEIDLDSIGSPDLRDYVSIDAVRAAIGDLIMIRPADPSDDGSMPAFVTLSQAIDRAQGFDAAERVDADSVSDAERIESDSIEAAE